LICPYCGNIDKDVEIPKITKRGKERVLGTCSNCSREVWAWPTTKKGEESQLATVKKGEKREDVLAEKYVNKEKGNHFKDMGKADDIDKKVFDAGGNLSYYLEIKERSNTLNAYRKTMFPYAKIERARKLVKDTGKPVHLVLKFRDCWARDVMTGSEEYEKGDEPFAPRYRPSQRNKQRQVPVKIPVEELDVLSWRDFCEDIEKTSE